MYHDSKTIIERYMHTKDRFVLHNNPPSNLVMGNNTSHFLTLSSLGVACDESHGPSLSPSRSCSQTMTPSATCLAVDAACSLGTQLEPLAGMLTCGLSMWPGFPHSMTAGFQEQVSRENEPGGSNAAFKT